MDSNTCSPHCIEVLISIIIIIDLLHNYFLLTKNMLRQYFIAVSLIQYIFYMKNTFYITPKCFKAC